MEASFAVVLTFLFIAAFAVGVHMGAGLQTEHFNTFCAKEKVVDQRCIDAMK